MGHTKTEIESVFATHGGDRLDTDDVQPEEQIKMQDDLKRQRLVRF
jgi:hypothetical protein